MLIFKYKLTFLFNIFTNRLFSYLTLVLPVHLYAILEKWAGRKRTFRKIKFSHLKLFYFSNSALCCIWNKKESGNINECVLKFHLPNIFNGYFNFLLENSMLPQLFRISRCSNFLQLSLYMISSIPYNMFYWCHLIQFLIPK